VRRDIFAGVRPGRERTTGGPAAAAVLW
jgi:hypothetical protein